MFSEEEIQYVINIRMANKCYSMKVLLVLLLIFLSQTGAIENSTASSNLQTIVNGNSNSGDLDPGTFI